MIKKYLYMLLSVLVLTGCKEKKQSIAAEVESEAAKPTFEIPSVPMMITDPAERAEYLVNHYWEKFDFADTTYIHFPEVSEQAFANYLTFIYEARPEVAFASLKAFVKKTEADQKIFDYFRELSERYLYDPNSPYRSDELYIRVLEALLDSPLLNETERIRPAKLLELARKNRVGEKALDFNYMLADGKTSSLYKIKAEYLILFFNNPDCSTCREIIKEMAGSFLIETMLKSDRLKVLAMYADEDLEAWRQHQAEMPKEWINAYDRQQVLNSEELYDLKAIPSLYLLDKDKTVLLKDVDYRVIADYLSRVVK